MNHNWNMAHPRTGISHQDFIQKVRRYSTIALISELGNIPRPYLDAGGDMELIQKLPPWVVAGIARDSFVHSNKFNRVEVLGLADLIELSKAYQNIYEPNDESGELLIAKIVTRLAWEQFSHQESDIEEIGRFLAIYNDPNSVYSQTLQLAFEKSLGMTSQDFANLSVIVYAISNYNSGEVPLDIFSHEALSDYLRDYDEEIFRKFVYRISIDQSGFRLLDNEYSKGVLPVEMKYRPNILTHFPILKLTEGKHIAPLPRLVLRRITHARVYRDCFEVGSQEYSSAIGYAFENYLGRQLQLLSGGLLLGERFWDSPKGRSASVDWILVTENAVLLIESKSSKLSEIASFATEKSFEVTRGIISEALSQIDTTIREIRNMNPVFDDIPRDLPFLGICVTAENLIVSNNPIVRNYVKCDIPFLTLTLRELEHCVPSDANYFSKSLIEISRNEHRKYNMLHSELPSDMGSDRNPILDSFIDKLEVFAEVPK